MGAGGGGGRGRLCAYRHIVTTRITLVLRRVAMNVSGYRGNVRYYLTIRANELCENRRGRPGLSVPNSPYGLCGRKATLNSNLNLRTEFNSNLNLRTEFNLNLNLRTEFRSFAKVEVDVLDSPSLIVLMVSVGVNQQLKNKKNLSCHLQTIWAPKEICQLADSLRETCGITNYGSGWSGSCLRKLGLWPRGRSPSHWCDRRGKMLTGKCYMRVGGEPFKANSWGNRIRNRKSTVSALLSF